MTNKIEQILALASLGLLADSNSIPKTKTVKRKKQQNVCPKCGSHRFQQKKGNKRKCLSCGKVFENEITIFVKEDVE